MRQRLLIQAYEAAEPSRYRKPRRQRRSANDAVRRAGLSIREQAIAQDEDHDLVVGILDTFVTNVIGAKGIQIEPQPRRRDGEIHVEFAEQIQEARRDWERYPETTREMNNAAMERLACLTWARDGEVFGQHLSGNVAMLDHGTRVPYSIEMIDPSYCPIGYDDASRGIIQGVERNAWGRPRGYWVYKDDPNSVYSVGAVSLAGLKRIAAANMMHVKMTRRIKQCRGVSLLTAALPRLEDLKEYEAAERIAAKIASAMAMYVKKGTPDLFDTGTGNTDADAPEYEGKLAQVAPGMMWVNLAIGEEVGTVDSNRPSNLLTPFRESMLRAAVSSAKVGYSSASKNYSGTYSAQRQEQVEQYGVYLASQGHFIGQWSEPGYLRFLASALASGELVIPSDVDPLTVDDAEFRGPVQPWIDPGREANANLIMVQAGFKSRAQVIRERGGVPQHVANEIQRERRQDNDREMVFSSDYATAARNASPLETSEPDTDSDRAAS
jgi:lambda family phage portal protein